MEPPDTADSPDRSPPPVSAIVAVSLHLLSTLGVLPVIAMIRAGNTDVSTGLMVFFIGLAACGYLAGFAAGTAAVIRKEQPEWLAWGSLALPIALSLIGAALW
ncbi:MAG: hypothetical protein ACFE0O_09425 [Opitutales bacterium]